MSAHPAPRATRAIRAETAGSSALALGPNQRGKGGGEVEASIPFMAMAHQRTPRSFSSPGGRKESGSQKRRLVKLGHRSDEAPGISHDQPSQNRVSESASHHGHVLVRCETVGKSRLWYVLLGLQHHFAAKRSAGRVCTRCPLCFMWVETCSRIRCCRRLLVEHSNTEPFGMPLATACHSCLKGRREAGTTVTLSSATPARRMARGALLNRYGRYGCIGVR